MFEIARQVQRRKLRGLVQGAKYYATRTLIDIQNFHLAMKMTKLLRLGIDGSWK
jgi:hypothetical protein